MSDEGDGPNGIEQRAQAMQDEIESWFRRRQRGDWARIIKMARKPSKAEFRQTVIVCGIGMFVLWRDWIRSSLANGQPPSFFLRLVDLPYRERPV